jgi:hypothetical protein
MQTQSTIAAGRTEVRHTYTFHEGRVQRMEIGASNTEE